MLPNRRKPRALQLQSHWLDVKALECWSRQQHPWASCCCIPVLLDATLHQWAGFFELGPTLKPADLVSQLSSHCAPRPIRQAAGSLRHWAALKLFPCPKAALNTMGLNTEPEQDCKPTHYRLHPPLMKDGNWTTA